MTHKSLRNTVGIASLTALALTMVACGGSSSSTPAAVNHAPTGVTLNGASAGKVGHSQIFNLVATDPDGDAITFSTTTAGASITGTVLTYLPTTAGVQTITVTATDAKGATATGSAGVLVSANQAPSFTVPSTINIGAGGAAQTFVVGNATDADGDTATYSLAAGAPTWVTFNAATRTLTVAPTGAVTPGAYTVTLNATDAPVAPAATASTTVTINVGALPAGQITGYPSNTTVIYAGLPFTFQFSAGSPLPGDSITGYTLDNGAGGAAPANSSVTAGGLFTWTPAATIALGDPVFFGVTATFASGVKAYQTFQLTPSVVNSAPVWSAGSLFAAPTKLNGTTDATLATTYGAVLSWPGSTPNTYTIPDTGITVTDVDITPTTDADTFTIVKAVIVGDTTNAGAGTDVLAQITANGGSLSFAPGTLTGNVYAAGTLTFKAPLTGTVKVVSGATTFNLGQATIATVAAAQAGNLKVTVRATDKGGKTADHVIEIPVRRNAAPVVDNKAAGGAALTSGDDTTDVTGAALGVFANPQPAYGVSNTWTLYTTSPTTTTGTQGEATDVNADPVTVITVSNAKVNGVADSRITGAVTGGNLVVSAPVWTAADARKAYSFDVVATDKFGAVSKAVTFSGTINGTVADTQTNTWVWGSGATTTNTANPYSFAAGGQVPTINPYYQSGPAVRIGKFNTDLGTPVTYAYSGDANGNFSITSVPGSVYYANTNVTVGYPTNWIHYSDASTVHYDIKGSGRISPFRTASKAAVATTGATSITAHFQYVNTFDKNNDVFQVINWNLGTKHFTSADAGTGPNYFKSAGANLLAWPYARTTNWVSTNNLADLDYTVNYYAGLSGTDANSLVDYVKGDTLMFGRMTKSTITDATSTKTAKMWQLQTVATPNLASTFVMTDLGANNMNATFDPFFNYQANSITGAISRSAFNANMLLATNATITPSYAGDNLAVLAQPHTAANGNIETGAPTLLQVEDLSGNANAELNDGTADVNFGTLKFGSLANTTPVYSYTYNYTVPTTGFTAAAAGSMGIMDSTIPTTGAIAPGVTPVTNLVVSNGVDVDGATTFENAYVNTGVDPDGAGALTATIGGVAGAEGQIMLKWDAQAGVSGYIVKVWNVTGGAVAQSAAPVKTIYTGKNSLLLPAAVLGSTATGQKYIFQITTVKMNGVDFNTDPFKKAFPYSWADAFSGVITLQ